MQLDGYTYASEPFQMNQNAIHRSFRLNGGGRPVRTRTADLYGVKLRRPRRLPKYAEVVHDIALCELECGLEKGITRLLSRGGVASRIGPVASPDTSC